MSGLSPARKLLAEEISRLREAQSALGAIERAIGWDGAASVAVAEARNRVEAAEDNVHTAKAGRVRALEPTAAGGEADAPPLTMREARLALEEAKGELEAAQAAKAALSEKLEPAGMAVGLAKIRTQDAAHAVVREAMLPRSAEVFERYHQQRQLMDDIDGAVRWLMMWKAIEGGPRGFRRSRKAAPLAPGATASSSSCRTRPHRFRRNYSNGTDDNRKPVAT